MIRVLLVEDDQFILESIRTDLEEYGDCNVFPAMSANEALQIHEELEVILLDIMLPDISGIDLCGKLRRRHHCPIIFISCLDDSPTIIEALGSGGDDYVVKPFDNMVLWARILANLRRVKMERNITAEEEILSCGNFVLDRKSDVLTRDGHAISLLPIESRLLAFLMQNAGNHYKSRELYQEIWGQDSAGDTRTVLVHIHNLRSKIEDDRENPHYICNIRGKGYTFRSREQSL